MCVPTVVSYLNNKLRPLLMYYTNTYICCVCDALTHVSWSTCQATEQSITITLANHSVKSNKLVGQHFDCSVLSQIKLKFIFFYWTSQRSWENQRLQYTFFKNKTCSLDQYNAIKQESCMYNSVIYLNAAGGWIELIQICISANIPKYWQYLLCIYIIWFVYVSVCYRVIVFDRLWSNSAGSSCSSAHRHIQAGRGHRFRDMTVT